MCRELETMTGREDWYAVFPTTPGLAKLNRYITQASKQIAGRHESITPSKVVAELTLGFWVSLLNSEYERLLWKDLRRAFPFLPKRERQRKNVSAPLNQFRTLRNRVFHNESICWNLCRVEEIHREMVTMMGWINKDVPGWNRRTDFMTYAGKFGKRWAGNNKVQSVSFRQPKPIPTGGKIYVPAKRGRGLSFSLGCFPLLMGCARNKPLDFFE